MVAKAAIVGLVILVVGLIVGVYGVYAPISGQKQVSYSLLNTQIGIDANDYASKNTVLGKGQTINVQASIANTTVFALFVMNQSQYYTFYGCAPFCRQGNVSGVGVIGPQNLTAQVNVTTITTSSSYNANFTAPVNGTYYFVLDNTVGPSYATYLGQNASVVACNTPNPFKCNTLVTLILTGYTNQTTYSVNWLIVGAGVGLLIIGGAIATAMWGSGKPKPKPSVTAGTVPPVTPTTPAKSS